MTRISPERATTLAELSRAEALLALARQGREGPAESAAAELEPAARERLIARLEARRTGLLARLGALSAVELPRHQLIEDLATLARDAVAGIGPEAETASTLEAAPAAQESSAARETAAQVTEEAVREVVEEASEEDLEDLIKPVGATTAEPKRKVEAVAARPETKPVATTPTEAAEVVKATREAVEAAAAAGPIRVVLRPNKGADEPAGAESSAAAAAAANEAEVSPTLLPESSAEAGVGPSPVVVRLRDKPVPNLFDDAPEAGQAKSAPEQAEGEAKPRKVLKAKAIRVTSARRTAADSAATVTSTTDSSSTDTGAAETDSSDERAGRSAAASDGATTPPPEAPSGRRRAAPDPMPASTGVLWGLVLGALILVGGSLALAVQLWQSENAPLKFTVFAAVSLGILGLSELILTRLKLKLTGQTLAGAFLMLAPLNLLAADSMEIAGVLSLPLAALLVAGMVQASSRVFGDRMPAVGLGFLTLIQLLPRSLAGAGAVGGPLGLFSLSGAGLLGAAYLLYERDSIRRLKPAVLSLLVGFLAFSHVLAGGRMLMLLGRSFSGEDLAAGAWLAGIALGAFSAIAGPEDEERERAQLRGLIKGLMAFGFIGLQAIGLLLAFGHNGLLATLATLSSAICWGAWYKRGHPMLAAAAVVTQTIAYEALVAAVFGPIETRGAARIQIWLDRQPGLPLLYAATGLAIHELKRRSVAEVLLGLAFIAGGLFGIACSTTGGLIIGVGLLAIGLVSAVRHDSAVGGHLVAWFAALTAARGAAGLGFDKRGSTGLVLAIVGLCHELTSRAIADRPSLARVRDGLLLAAPILAAGGLVICLHSRSATTLAATAAAASVAFVLGLIRDPGGLRAFALSVSLLALGVSLPYLGDSFRELLREPTLPRALALTAFLISSGFALVGRLAGSQGGATSQDSTASTEPSSSADGDAVQEELSEATRSERPSLLYRRVFSVWRSAVAPAGGALPLGAALLAAGLQLLSAPREFHLLALVLLLASGTAQAFAFCLTPGLLMRESSALAALLFGASGVALVRYIFPSLSLPAGVCLGAIPLVLSELVPRAFEPLPDSAEAEKHTAGWRLIATFDAVLLMLPVVVFAARGIVRSEAAVVAPGLASAAPMLLIFFALAARRERRLLESMLLVFHGGITLAALAPVLPLPAFARVSIGVIALPAVWLALDQLRERLFGVEDRFGPMGRAIELVVLITGGPLLFVAYLILHDDPVIGGVRLAWSIAVASGLLAWLAGAISRRRAVAVPYSLAAASLAMVRLIQFAGLPLDEALTVAIGASALLFQLIAMPRRATAEESGDRLPQGVEATLTLLLPALILFGLRLHEEPAGVITLALVAIAGLIGPSAGLMISGAVATTFAALELVFTVVPTDSAVIGLVHAALVNTGLAAIVHVLAGGLTGEPTVDSEASPSAVERGRVLRRMGLVNLVLASLGFMIAAFLSQERAVDPGLARIMSSLVAIVGLFVIWLREARSARSEVLVYVAEAHLALLFLFLRAVRPDLFKTGLFARFWPMIVMALAFLSTVLARLLQKAEEEVLSRAVGRTGLVLPLAPLIGGWSGSVNGGVSSLAILLASGLYVFAGRERRSQSLALGAIWVAALGVVRVLLWRELSFAELPWLFAAPVGAALLLMGRKLRDESPELARRSTEAGAMVVLAALSWSLFSDREGRLLESLMLAVLSLVGFAAGLHWKERSLMILSGAFLTLDLAANIYWLGQGQVWIWYVSLMALGAGVIVFFARFERSRGEDGEDSEEGGDG